MNLDITKLLSGKVRKLEFPIDIAPDAEGFAEYLPEDVVLTSGVGGEVIVTDKGEYISVEISPVVEYEIPCSRCLAPVKDTVDFTFERFIPTGTGFDSDDELYDEEDILTVIEGHIDVTLHIFEEIALELPDFVLCSNDCPGLCPKCGKLLADGDCSCDKKKEIDPRMKIFEKLLQDEE